MSLAAVEVASHNDPIPKIKVSSNVERRTSTKRTLSNNSGNRIMCKVTTKILTQSNKMPMPIPPGRPVPIDWSQQKPTDRKNWHPFLTPREWTNYRTWVPSFDNAVVERSHVSMNACNSIWPGYSRSDQTRFGTTISRCNYRIRLPYGTNPRVSLAGRRGRAHVGL